MSGVLSQDETQIDLGDEVTASLEADRERLPAAANEVANRYPNEPYRKKLKLMRERLDRVDDPRSGGYTDADGFRADLAALAADLRANAAESIASAHVDPLLRTVDIFEFTLASLDLRDHRAKHTETLAEVFTRQGVDYETMSEDERAELLTEATLEEGSLLESHVLEVLFPATEAGVVDLSGHCGLDIVPLLETEYALSGARQIRSEVIEHRESNGSGVETADEDGMRTTARKVALEMLDERPTTVETEVVGLIGNAADEIVRYASKQDARYVIVSPRQQSNTGKILFAALLSPFF